MKQLSGGSILVSRLAFQSSSSEENGAELEPLLANEASRRERVEETSRVTSYVAEAFVPVVKQLSRS